MEWWKIIALVYVGLYICLLIYQFLENRNKKRDRIKYEMERTERKDKTEKKIEKVKPLLEKPSISEKAYETASGLTGILSRFQQWILQLVYMIESLIRRQIEWMHEWIMSNLYVFLRKTRIV